ncbi:MULTISPECIES: Panacea domain-containing protein [Heyndrickxia]|uniref:Antitoxin SocA-like Panacea domain-containing protein n=1 Tax=Heyndrickxia coagulans TaxID=1398 RepID=A0A150K4L9_HEYCO|nr:MULTISPECIES: type II toxin-antitoxin system antitoxin SocA domain-containing protein [Heyndrickxia]KYC64499.1 hypothetical protein B4099_1015 [Heyndrickxia coagulans]MED4965349.1 DUF4065 domain-containing protein [Heyndrickxia coagulans]
MANEITYEEIANYFIALSNETGNLITNLKLQKLMYYVQSWHLAIYKEPWFDGQFQAWVHGPVLPELYKEYRDFKWHPIVRDDLDFNYIKNFEAKIGEDKTEFLKEICDEYFGMEAYELERLTHSESPWQLARRGIPEDEPSQNYILNEWMQEFYSQFTEKSNG